MNKFLRVLFYLFILFFGFYIIWAVLYDKIVSNALIEKNRIIEKSWSEYIKVKNLKNEKVLDYTQMYNVKGEIKDSLLFYLQNKFKDENVIYKSSDLNLFTINEYDSNKYIMKLMDEEVLDDEKAEKIKTEISLITNKTNDIVESYNNSVLKFNTCRSAFPNYFIANKYNFENIEFFKIKYGKENKNPKVKSNIERWIETGDSTYLK